MFRKRNKPKDEVAKLQQRLDECWSEVTADGHGGAKFAKLTHDLFEGGNLRQMEVAVFVLNTRFSYIGDDIEYYTTRMGQLASPNLVRRPFAETIIAGILPRIRAVVPEVTRDHAIHQLEIWFAIPDPDVEIPDGAVDNGFLAALLMAVTRHYHSWEAIADDFSDSGIQKNLAHLLKDAQ